MRLTSFKFTHESSDPRATNGSEQTVDLSWIRKKFALGQAKINVLFNTTGTSV
jgi:hypothetical protein